MTHRQWIDMAPNLALVRVLFEDHIATTAQRRRLDARHWRDGGYGKNSAHYHVALAVWSRILMEYDGSPSTLTSVDVTGVSPHVMRINVTYERWRHDIEWHFIVVLLSSATGGAGGACTADDMIDAYDRYGGDARALKQWAVDRAYQSVPFFTRTHTQTFNEVILNVVLPYATAQWVRDNITRHSAFEAFANGLSVFVYDHASSVDENGVLSSSQRRIVFLSLADNMGYALAALVCWNREALVKLGRETFVDTEKFASLATTPPDAWSRRSVTTLRRRSAEVVFGLNAQQLQTLRGFIVPACVRSPNAPYQTLFGR